MGFIVFSSRFLLFGFPMFKGSFQEGGPLRESRVLRVRYFLLVEAQCVFSCYLLLFLSSSVTCLFWMRGGAGRGRMWVACFSLGLWWRFLTQ